LFCFVFEAVSPYVVQAGLEFAICLSLLSASITGSIPPQLAWNSVNFSLHINFISPCIPYPLSEINNQYFLFIIFFLFFMVLLGFELRTLCLLGRFFTSWTTLPATSIFLLIDKKKLYLCSFTLKYSFYRTWDFEKYLFCWLSQNSLWYILFHTF
jgi:hypothetical protein